MFESREHVDGAGAWFYNKKRREGSLNWIRADYLPEYLYKRKLAHKIDGGRYGTWRPGDIVAFDFYSEGSDGKQHYDGVFDHLMTVSRVKNGVVFMASQSYATGGYSYGGSRLRDVFESVDDLAGGRKQWGKKVLRVDHRGINVNSNNTRPDDFDE